MKKHFAFFITQDLVKMWKAQLVSIYKKMKIQPTKNCTHLNIIYANWAPNTQIPILWLVFLTLQECNPMKELMLLAEWKN